MSRMRRTNLRLARRHPWLLPRQQISLGGRRSHAIHASSNRDMASRCRSVHRSVELHPADHVLGRPSRCQETFGRVIAEAYAKGTPVIASNIGAAPEMVRPGETGLLFEPGNAKDLARQICSSFSSIDCLRNMRRPARAEYESKYHAD